MKNSFLSAVPFVLLKLRAAEGALGSGNPAPEPGPFDAEKAPAIEGESLENKVSSATGIISKLFAAGKDLVSRLSTANNDRTRLEQQFDGVSTDLTNEKAAHTTTKGELGTAKTTIIGLTTERDNANKNVERLEKLCNLRGIDANTVVPPASSSQSAAGGNVWEQYSQLRDDERTGKAKPGSAFAFYQKNEKALKEHAAANRTSE